MSKEKEVLEKVKDKKLETFEWDDETPLEFFGQGVDDPTTLSKDEKEKVEILEKDDKVDDKKKTNTKEKKEEKKETAKPKEEEKEVEFFKEEKEDDKVDDTKKKKTTTEEFEEEDDKFFNTLAKGLKEQGSFTTVEIPEEPLSEEQFVALEEEEIDNRVQETFEGFFEELDKDGKAFLKFKKEGGKTSDFFSTLQTTSAYPKGDLSDESHQKKVIKYYAKNIEGLDEEEIDEKVEWLDETGKTEKFAKRYDTKIKDNAEKVEKKLLDDQKKAARLRADDDDKFKKDLKATLDKVDTINNFSFNKKEKAELLSYITKPAIKTGKNKYITAFQNELKGVSSDFESLILLAKLVKSKFDISSLEIKATTKKTKELKDDLQRTKQNIKPKSSGSSGKRELSDFFD